MQILSTFCNLNWLTISFMVLFFRVEDGIRRVLSQINAKIWSEFFTDGFYFFREITSLFFWFALFFKNQTLCNIPQQQTVTNGYCFAERKEFVGKVRQSSPWLLCTWKNDLKLYIASDSLEESSKVHVKWFSGIARITDAGKLGSICAQTTKTSIGTCGLPKLVFKETCKGKLHAWCYITTNAATFNTKVEEWPPVKNNKYLYCTV